MQDYLGFDGLELARLVATGQATARELLEAAIARAEAVNPEINALSQKHYDLAFEALEAPLPQGPFHGVPFLLKDAGARLAGTATSNGSRLFADIVADSDSTLVERYKQAGVVIFGKTTTPELSLAASAESSYCGTTRNPWNLTKTVGGSSGGAAAAVAAGIVPVAHASDGGGSIRIPASCCGLFGMKPTRARNPSGPGVGEGWGSLSVDHVVSRTVRDSAAMLDATHGAAPGDPYCAPVPERPFLEEVGLEPRRLRIAFQRAPLSGVPVHPECLAAAEETARLLESLGHIVEEAQPAGDWDELGYALWVLVASNVSRSLRMRAKQLGVAFEPDLVDKITWTAVEFSADLSVESYPEALAVIHWQGRLMARFHERFDVVMSPTLAQPPVTLGVQHTNNPDLEAYRAAFARFTPFTQLFNLTGQPSMSVPLHWSSEATPIGMMFSARFGDEAPLFRLAGQLERARPWIDRYKSLPR